MKSQRHGLVAIIPLFLAALIILNPSGSWAQGQSGRLIITDEPVLSETVEGPLYQEEVAPPVLSKDLLGPEFTNPDEQTRVGQRVQELRQQLRDFNAKLQDLATRSLSLERRVQEASNNYYADVATLNSRLQSGTTPGNPRMVKRLNSAQNSLDDLSEAFSQYNDLSLEANMMASRASFLLESVLSAFNLSGAVEEDHANLRRLEDAVNDSIRVLDRIEDKIGDNLGRGGSYLSTERKHLRTLALAVKNGELYARSLARHPFSSPALSETLRSNASLRSRGDLESMGIPSGPRPLINITFDQPTVKYEQELFMAVNEALDRFPEAKFLIVAVAPGQGNAAQVALESSRARSNAEKVYESLRQFGLPENRMELATTKNPDARDNQVRINIL